MTDTVDFRFIAAEEIRSIPQPNDVFDFAINVASMQEMDPQWVEFYFQWLRSALKTGAQFYCCNRVSKTLPDGTKSEFIHYPWRAGDRVLLDEMPAFYDWFFSRQKTARRVRVFGLPVPFMRLFDGDHWHRLVELEKVRV